MADKVHQEWQPFGRKLKQVRMRAGLSQSGLGGALQLTGAMVGHLERATRIPNREHVRKMDRALATDGDLEDIWLEVVQGEPVLPWFRDSLEMERRSETISEYHPILIPGLLQTRAYTRVLVAARQVRKTPKEVDEVVELRAGRLPAIRPNRPVLWFVVERNVIDRIIGDASVMREQLQHITELASAGVIRFQVIPDDVRHHPGLCAPFRLMNMQGGRKAVRMEHTLGGTRFDRGPEIEEMAELFGTLQAEALSPRVSLELLHDTMKGLR